MHMVHAKHPYTKKEKIKYAHTWPPILIAKSEQSCLSLTLDALVDPSPCHKWLQLSPVLTVVANMNWVNQVYCLGLLVLT